MPTENTTAITLRQENGPTSFRASTIWSQASAVMMGVIVVGMIVMVSVVSRALRGSPNPGLLGAQPSAPEAPELGDQQIQADQSNQRVAHAFELVRPGIDLKPGAAHCDEQHTDEHNRR